VIDGALRDVLRREEEMMKRDDRRTVSDRRRLRLRRLWHWLLGLNLVLVLPAAVSVLVALAGALAAAEPVAAVAQSDTVVMWGFIAAAVSTGLSALAAGYAVSHVGAAALGAMGERPEIAGRALIFVGLAEGIAIYGLIISIMILGRLG
jgi:V/A-type H+-transporting ATPase subunit K